MSARSSALPVERERHRRIVGSKSSSSDHLSKLKVNRWIDYGNVRGVYTIRPGERMRKLWPKARG